MESEKQRRSYALMGELQPEQWEQLEATLGRLGLDMVPWTSAAESLQRFREQVVSRDSLTRKKFYDFAASEPEFSPVLAGRAWNQLTLIYAAKQQDKYRTIGRPVPTEFVGAPLEYEVERYKGGRYQYTQGLDYLTAESLIGFVGYLDEEIGEDDKISSRDLPANMGVGVVKFLRAFSQHLQDVAAQETASE